MGAIVDLVRVLFEPVPVFERVREKPRFLLPFLALAAVQLALGIINLPFMQAAMRAQMAQAGAPAGGPDRSGFVWIGIVAAPIGVAIFLLIAALILWILVSIFGGEGKFTTLLSMTLYTAVPSLVLMGIIGAIVLRLRGAESISSFMDMQPALGLDLLAPGARGFVGAVLKGINPFSIWGLVLTAIGVSVTHRLPKSTGYTIAIISFAIGLLAGAGLAGMGGGMGGGR
jgi:hypothetical protein